ncbi:MAG: TIR domain-containing protein [Novosphingobium sp.]
MPDYRYKAFVSYSWADAEWGKWLLHAIETYRTPKAMIGQQGAHGPVPERLHPLFKDREEEAAGASIGAAVEAALRSSEFLIVVCSPRSAQSQWVNHEVAWFKTHRDPNNILALIVDGEPGGGALECFPKALTHQVLPDLTVTDTPVDAPLAADARITGDGKRGARLKIAAAMLGVGLGELVNRDERRRTLRTRLVVASSLALATVMGGMAWYAIQARNEAEFQRAESDGLVEFMLTDLRERLEPVGRLDALDVVGKRALRYYAGQKASRLDADALGRRARALHLVGEVSNIRGDSIAGLTAFREAAATTAEQLARDPDNPQRIFDHAQSVFWVGYIAYERGEAKEAEAQFREYKRLADQLVAIDPNKPEWQMEVSYAESNLGVMFYEQQRYAEAEPAFAKALVMVEAVAAGQKKDLGRQLEVGVAMNWLGKARDALNRFDQAELLHRREIDIYQGVLKADPANNLAKVRLATAWQHIASIVLVKGNLPAAITAEQNSLAIMAELRKIEPANTEWQETEARATLGLTDALYFAGQFEASAQLNAAVGKSLDRLVAADPNNTIWSIDLRSWQQWQKGRLALYRGKSSEALSIFSAITRRLDAARDSNNGDRAIHDRFVRIATGDALARLGRRPEAVAVWQKALAEVGAEPLVRPVKVMRGQYMLLKRLGRKQEAVAIAALLDRQGDRSPAYLREK